MVNKIRLHGRRIRGMPLVLGGVHVVSAQKPCAEESLGATRPKLLPHQDTGPRLRALPMCRIQTLHREAVAVGVRRGCPAWDESDASAKDELGVLGFLADATEPGRRAGLAVLASNSCTETSGVIGGGCFCADDWALCGRCPSSS